MQSSSATPVGSFDCRRSDGAYELRMWAGGAFPGASPDNMHNAAENNHWLQFPNIHRE